MDCWLPPEEGRNRSLPRADKRCYSCSPEVGHLSSYPWAESNPTYAHQMVNSHIYYSTGYKNMRRIKNFPACICSLPSNLLTCELKYVGRVVPKNLKYGSSIIIMYYQSYCEALYLFYLSLSERTTSFRNENHCFSDS